MDAPLADLAHDGPNPSPVLIPGGGINGGPIDGVANIYVIDDATRLPIGSASVALRVGPLYTGGITGKTNATGLFVAEGVNGPQDVIVIAAGYRSEVWLSANGTDVTIDMVKTAAEVPPSANLSGTIDLSSFTVGSGDTLAAVVAYSQTDNLAAAANAIATGSGANLCVVAAPPPASQTCSFTVASRAGTVGLIAAVLDESGSGAGNTLLGWAAATGLTVEAGSDQTGIALDVVPANQIAPETFVFDTPPSGLTQVDGTVGIDLGSAGVLPLPFDIVPVNGSATLAIPELSSFGSATYTFIAAAVDPTAGSGTIPTSTALTCNQSGSTISVASWLTPPTDVVASTAMATWTPTPNAVIESVVYSQGATQLVDVIGFNDAAGTYFPESIVLPSSGAPLTATVTAFGGSLQPDDFSFDQDRDQLTGISSQPVVVTSGSGSGSGSD